MGNSNSISSIVLRNCSLPLDGYPNELISPNKCAQNMKSFCSIFSNQTDSNRYLSPLTTKLFSKCSRR